MSNLKSGLRVVNPRHSLKFDGHVLNGGDLVIVTDEVKQVVTGLRVNIDTGPSQPVYKTFRRIISRLGVADVLEYILDDFTEPLQ